MAIGFGILQRCKKRGKCQEFLLTFEDNIKTQLDLLANLRDALANEDLVLYLQPKVSLERNQIVGYEALIRWPHQTKGMIPPSSFIPIAEKQVFLLTWIFMCFTKQQKFLKKIPRSICLFSINISSTSLLHSDFIDALKLLWQKYPFDISKIELEVTEGAFIRSDLAINQCNELKALGFTLCLDDFGTGHSSLSYLLKLPMDVIKIDRSFVIAIPEDHKALILLQGIIDICHELGKSIVVEGVETQEQIDFLKKQNVDVVQGFFYFKPMPVNDIIAIN